MVSMGPMPGISPGQPAFGNTEGMIRHPETFSKAFTKAVARCHRDPGPAVPLHLTRPGPRPGPQPSTTGTMSHRPGPMRVTITSTRSRPGTEAGGTGQTGSPGDQKRAATQFAELVAEA